MGSPNTTSGAVASSANALPLFREEAVAAQRQRVYGEIVRIQPFSLVFLVVLTLFIAFVIFGFLYWASYSGQAHLSPVMILDRNDRELLADTHIPDHAMPFLGSGMDMHPISRRDSTQ